MANSDADNFALMDILDDPVLSEMIKDDYRGYAIEQNATHTVIRSPQGYLMYEVPGSDNKQECERLIDAHLQWIKESR